MKTKSIDELIESCLQFLKETSYNKGTSLPVISDTLGHSSSESTMVYLGIDVKRLLECALDVPFVQDKFYTQKEGAFYE